MDVRSLIRDIIKEAAIDANGVLQGLRLSNNKFYTHVVDEVMRKFLVQGDDEFKHPFLKRNNGIVKFFSSAVNVQGHEHVKVFQPDGHAYDYIQIKGKIYPSYFLGMNKIDFDAHFKDLNNVRNIDDLDIEHFGNDFAGKLVHDLIARFPPFGGDPARFEGGRQMVVDLFDILDVTGKKYVGYFNDPNKYKKDGSIDGTRLGIKTKLYNFVE